MIFVIGKKLFSSNLDCENMEEENGELQKNGPLFCTCRMRFWWTDKNCESEPINDRFYLPGSLSQLVFHAAPGYEPLPKPCSLPYIDQNGGADKSDSDEEVYDPDTSGSLDEENSSDYSSGQSISGSSEVSGSNETMSGDEGDNNADPLIQISNTSF